MKEVEEKEITKKKVRFYKKPFHWFKHTRRRNKIITIVILIVAMFFVWGRIQAANKKPDYTLAKATKADITETVTETGNIATSGRTDIYSPTNGIIENVYVKNGDYVTAGQELFTIVSSATEQEKSQALANYLTAQNSLDTANASLYSLQSDMFAKWDAYKGIAESDSYENSDGTPKTDQRANAEFHVAEKSWNAAEANYKKQQAVISQARAAVSTTSLAYQATQNATVKATADGTISNLSVTLGNAVKANSPTAPSQPLATIANFATTEVIVALSENDIAKVRDGQKAEVEVKAVRGKTYRGVVRRVDTIATNDQGVMKYNAYVEIVNDDEKLRPGMTADAQIVTEELKNVLTVPNAAVKPYEGGRAVRVIDPKTKELKYIPVEIGIRGSTKTQILKGITEGQEVVTALSNEEVKRQSLF